MKKEIKTSVGLIIILAFTVLFGGGALAYFYMNQPTTFDYEVQDSGKTVSKATTTATADWQTYTNTEVGFNFKYPKGWGTSSNDVETIFSSNEKDAQILAGKSQGNLSNDSITLDITKESRTRYSSDSEALSSLEGRKASTFVFANVKLGEVNAVKATRTVKKGEQFAENPNAATVDTEEIVYNVINNSNLIRFWFTIYGNNSNVQLVNQIIQTAQFTDVTAGWQTYTNNMGYTIKYPSDWTPSNDTDASVNIRNNSVNYSLGITVVDSQLSLSDYTTSLKSEAQDLINSNRPGNRYGTESNIIIGGQSAIKITDCYQGASGYKFDWYFVKNGDSIFKISVTKKVDEGPVFNIEPYIPISENILSTFQFTK